ncbi:MAG: hypothetical protein PW734_06655 [Verrucomicrobium sp.]|nr:hypothetical protein [Verrucomicrobium sp.]
MNKTNLSLMLSMAATAISIFSFFGSAWRSWRERPRLRFTFCRVIQRVNGEKEFNQVEVKVSNIGFRPITLTAFKAIAKNGLYHMGDTDPTAAAYGVAKDVFPVCLNAGNTIKFYPLTVEGLIKNQTDPGNPSHHFGRWIYFVLVDGFGGYHHIYVQDILKCLMVPQVRSPRTKWRKAVDFISRQFLFRAVKKREPKF